MEIWKAAVRNRVSEWVNDVKRREKNAKDRNIKWKTRQTAKEQKSTVHTYVSMEGDFWYRKIGLPVHWA